jgi:hypothetical protein
MDSGPALDDREQPVVTSPHVDGLRCWPRPSVPVVGRPRSMDARVVYTAALSVVRRVLGGYYVDVVRVRRVRHDEALNRSHRPRSAIAREATRIRPDRGHPLAVLHVEWKESQGSAGQRSCGTLSFFCRTSQNAWTFPIGSVALSAVETPRKGRDRFHRREPHSPIAARKRSMMAASYHPLARSASMQGLTPSTSPSSLARPSSRANP